MTVEAPTAPVLAYEPAGARTWGPWVFRPSVVSICLGLLVAGSAFWLAKRHHAWAQGPTIDAPAWCVWKVALPDDDRVVAVVPSQGARVWDSHTGALIAKWGPDYTTGKNASLSNWARRESARWENFYLAPGGRWLAVHPSSGVPGIRVYNTRDGSLAYTLPMEEGCGSTRVLGLSPDGRTMLLRQQAAEERTTTMLLTMTPEGTRQAQVDVGGGTVDMSPDGRWLLVRGPPVQVLDAQTLQPRCPKLGSAVERARSFSNDGRYLLIEGSSREWWDMETGERLSLTWPSGAAVSPDGQRVAYVTSGVLDIFDVASAGKLCEWGDARLTGQGCFMPDSTRFLQPDNRRNALMMCEAPHRQPVALMGTPSGGWGYAHAYTSPSGQVVAATPFNLGEIRLFRKVGGECRESNLGVLGMPHCWLLLAAMAGGGFSLWRDARKGNVERTAGGTIISAGLIVLGVVGTAKLLIDGCLGQWHPNPAPLLVLSGVALATGGRGWRAVTLVMVGWLAALVAFACARAMKGGLRGWLTYDLFDRTYTIPRWSPVVGLAVVGVVLGMVVLAISLRMRRRIA